MTRRPDVSTLSTCFAHLLASLSLFPPAPVLSFIYDTSYLFYYYLSILVTQRTRTRRIRRVRVFLPFFSLSLSAIFPNKDFPLMDRVTLLLYLRTLTAGGHTFHLITPLLDPPPLPQLNFQFHPFPSFSPPPPPTSTPTSTSVNFLLLSPYKNAPVLFARPRLIAISVTPYYISNDWL